MVVNRPIKANRYRAMITPRQALMTRALPIQAPFLPLVDLKDNKDKQDLEANRERLGPLNLLW